MNSLRDAFPLLTRHASHWAMAKTRETWRVPRRGDVTDTTQRQLVIRCWLRKLLPVYNIFYSSAHHGA